MLNVVEVYLWIYYDNSDNSRFILKLLTCILNSCWKNAEFERESFDGGHSGELQAVYKGFQRYLLWTAQWRGYQCIPKISWRRCK